MMSQDPTNPFEDRPISEIIIMIRRLQEKWGKGLTTWIKFTCDYCGARQTSDDADTFHVGGYTCEECGELSHPVRYGLRLSITSTPETQHLVDEFMNKLKEEEGKDPTC